MGVLVGTTRVEQRAEGGVRRGGREALVTEAVTTDNPGRVKLAGEIWSAQPYDERMTIAAGETVEVLAMKGATVFVHPVATAIEP